LVFPLSARFSALNPLYSNVTSSILFLA
jgi:hypothetical protein